MRDLTPVPRKVDEDDWLYLDYSFGQVQACRNPYSLYGYIIKIYIDNADKTISLNNTLLSAPLVCLLLSGFEEGAQYALDRYKYNVSNLVDDTDYLKGIY